MLASKYSGLRDICKATNRISLLSFSPASTQMSLTRTLLTDSNQFSSLWRSSARLECKGKVRALTVLERCRLKMSLMMLKNWLNHQFFPRFNRMYLKSSFMMDQIRSNSIWTPYWRNASIKLNLQKSSKTLNESRANRRLRAKATSTVLRVSRKVSKWLSTTIRSQNRVMLFWSSRLMNVA